MRLSEQDMKLNFIKNILQKVEKEALVKEDLIEEVSFLIDSIDDLNSFEIQLRDKKMRKQYNIELIQLYSSMKIVLFVISGSN